MAFDLRLAALVKQEAHEAVALVIPNAVRAITRRREGVLGDIGHQD
jgi:hypothetical protein